jgi:hypothetical protein
MSREQVERARSKYQEIHDGREGHWFDPGEYEQLKQDWFDEYGEMLLELAEKATTPDPVLPG